METVKDLFEPKNLQSSATNLSQWRAIEIEVTSLEDVQRMLSKADRNRSMGATALNLYSSRSHSIHKLNISVMENGQETVNGNLVMIDLAGSERLDDSKATGHRKEESIAINKSLSALGDVINAISQESSHVPYRNSKLTSLLQNYMGVDSKVLMIVNISPLQDHAHETLTSLQFARKVNQCKVEKSKQQAKPGILP